MREMTLRSKFLLVIVILIPIFMYLYFVKNGGSEGTTQIFEIKNTKIIYNYPDSKMATMEKHYMIINPPEDLDELKKVIEIFHKENPIDNEITVQKKTKSFEVFSIGKVKSCQ